MLTQLNCPRCQTPFNAEIHQVVDVGQNPQLKYELLNGTLNIFVCPNCGMSGQLATPILYHDPENEIFMVYVPMEMDLPHEERQKMIGQMVQEAMSNIPQEERRGYMLQPEEVLRYQTFIEKILETEGVTKEMIERQREQSELLQEMITADKETVGRLIEERAEQIDETFFAILRSAIEAAQQQDNSEEVIKLVNLQARLYTETEVGQEMEKRQAALRAFQQEVRQKEALTPDLLLKHVLRNREDEGTVDALIASGQQVFDYQFFTLLTEKVEEEARKHNKEEAKALRSLRQRLLDMHNELQEQSRQILEGATGTLQEILEAEDRREAIRENVAHIDDAFMYVLSALIAQSEEQGQSAQAEDLKEVQQLIMEEAERQVPPQIRIINRLLRAESDAEQRQILDQNPELLTPELVQMLNALASEVAEDGQDSDMEERIQKLRAMVEMRI